MNLDVAYAMLYSVFQDSVDTVDLIIILIGIDSIYFQDNAMT